ncbi:MAG: 5-formyltetrahydrofolate cyclo-ligase [Bacillota bacterium]
MLTKKEIRSAVLAERSAIDEETAALAAQVICRRIMDIDLYEEATDLCLYMPTRNEVDVLLLAEPAEAAGKRVWVPKVVEKTSGKGSLRQAGTMVFNRFTGLGEDDIIIGAYDIRESRSEEILEPCEGTLIIMPGAVFTPWKDRIGYGGGFYDRFLEEHPECKTIAVCYDLQVVDELPTEEHDMKPDYVVCETSVFK